MMSLSSLVTGPTLVITHPNDFSQHTVTQIIPTTFHGGANYCDHSRDKQSGALFPLQEKQNLKHDWNWKRKRTWSWWSYNCKEETLSLSLWGGCNKSWWSNAKIRRSLRLDPNTECQLHDDHHFFNMTMKLLYGFNLDTYFDWFDGDSGKDDY